jgi:hypothetical protein
VTGLRTLSSPIRCFVEFLAVACLTVICLGQAGTYVSIQEVRVSGLPVLVAPSHQPMDVLRTSVATIVHDRSVCCGEDSALRDSVERADPQSLKDVADKLQGRHLLSDGRPIMVSAEYSEPATINASVLIATLRDKHATLFEWNSHLYVCNGVTYRRDYDYTTGAQVNTVLKFLLLDTRYSGSRRRAIFNRETDDWSKVQGLMRLTVAPQ